jgi:hypothetical protein
MDVSKWRIRKKFGRWRIYRPGESIYSVYSGATHAHAIGLMMLLRSDDD